jgi:hypothetical protein
MPAEVLVMCESCGRPQWPRKAGCVHCGAKLPDSPAGAKKPATPKEKLFDAFEPFLEGDFGRGGVVLLSQRKLEWKLSRNAPRPARSFHLVDLAEVRLERRPAWEALIFLVIPAALAFFVRSGPGRYALAGVALFILLACLSQRRYSFHVSPRDGKDPLGVLLAVGTSSAPGVVRAMSVWETLATELKALGVKVRDPS